MSQGGCGFWGLRALPGIVSGLESQDWSQKSAFGQVQPAELRHVWEQTGSVQKIEEARAKKCEQAAGMGQQAELPKAGLSGQAV